MSKSAQKLDILHKSGKTVFSTNELGLYWNIENKLVLYVQISRLKNQGFLKSVQRGLYAISGVEIDKFELAGNLKRNSYLSFETILAKEGLIHQWYGAYFSAADRKLEINNTYGKFIYKRLPENVLNNRLGIINTGTYFVATKERAVCDYFYRVGLQQLDDVSEVDANKLIQIATIYESKRLESDIKKLTQLIS